MLREKLWVYTLIKGLNIFHAKEPYFQLGSSIETRLEKKQPIHLYVLIISDNWQLITLLDL